MQIFRRPNEEAVRRLLAKADLPAVDLTPEHFEHFFGCVSEQAPEGVVGLEICGSEALLRSLAVAEEARGRGFARALVAEVERYAQTKGVRRIYLLTTTAAGFFARLGYRTVPRDEAPESIRATREFSTLCPASSAFMVKEVGAAPA